MPLNIEKIRELREAKGMTQHEAAQAARMTSRQSWYQIESGTYPNLTIETLERVAKALGVKARDLLK